ncbi:hypothetical protein HMPREF3216_01158, partial [Gardnerella vaginalis]
MVQNPERQVGAPARREILKPRATPNRKCRALVCSLFGQFGKQKQEKRNKSKESAIPSKELYSGRQSFARSKRANV